MPVKYLSQEWIDAYNDALAGDAVRGGDEGQERDHPDGDLGRAGGG